MKVGILGDGPAGRLAARLFGDAGHEVRHWSNGANPPQARHIHVFDPRLPGELDALGLPQADRQACGAWHLVQVTGPELARKDWMGERCGRGDVMTRLGTGTAASIASETLMATHDLLIDATGAARALLRTAHCGDFECVYDDCGGLERYRTWCGDNPSQQGNRLVRCHAGCTAYLETTARDWRLTVIEDAESDPVEDADIIRFLAEWGLRVELPRPRQMTGPVARRVSAQQWWDSGMRVLPFGDALLQTSPSLGFGLLCVVQQAGILKQWLETGGEVSRLAGMLDGYAEAVWHEAAMSSLMK